MAGKSIWPSPTERIGPHVLPKEGAAIGSGSCIRVKFCVLYMEGFDALVVQIYVAEVVHALQYGGMDRTTCWHAYDRPLRLKIVRKWHRRGGLLPGESRRRGLRRSPQNG